MITLVDYGLGNIQAFANIYERLGIPVRIATNAQELFKAERIILPGVGAFDYAMERLNTSGMRDCLDDLVMNKKRPVLGVCVGMQMMAKRSDEGALPGLGWIDGEVRRFDEATFSQRTRLPHMGWNDVSPRRSGALFRGLEHPKFYFLHSYYFSCRVPEEVLAVTDYNGPFASAIHAHNIYGVQFHPEKSHAYGVELLKNFATM